MVTMPAPGIRTVDAESYVVHIGAGLRHRFAEEIVRVAPAHRFAIISDEHVAPLYAAALEDALSRHGRATTHLVVPGEENKTRTSWARLTDELLDAGCARDTTVVALGGGVVGDLAGFVAATFMRGVPVVQCPTSLLAMIDASVGGKTGVDTAAGKNLVGAFHPPAAVLADVEMIASLPIEERCAGLAEAIKHGAIADAAHFAEIDRLIPELLDAGAAALTAIVGESVAIKASVVRADPRERGVRKILNFGHTLGHAIEQASGYALLHGECVAIGMVLEARLAESLGIADAGTARAIEEVLTRASLPVAMPSTFAAAQIVELTHRDKKARKGRVEYALPARIGEMARTDDGEWAIGVGDDAVHALLA